MGRGGGGEKHVCENTAEKNAHGRDGEDGGQHTHTQAKEASEAVSGCCCVVVAKYHAHSPAVSLSFSFWGT